MKSAKNYIALFFIALFLLFKVTGLHALSHHNDEKDIQHCDICTVSSAINFTPLLKTEVTVLPDAEYLFIAQKLNAKTYIFAFHKKHLSSSLFTRPPPLFL
ncbi:hypothetical protein [Aquimarina agarilytica]|uniref:hypothetical protein n=1 Tax=Aquimarina agarilytica TaxID=1087449 RepID=UPI0002887F84|nr:hypothetical protein [Aquimarina agarilytica]